MGLKLPLQSSGSQLYLVVCGYRWFRRVVVIIIGKLTDLGHGDVAVTPSRHYDAIRGQPSSEETKIRRPARGIRKKVME